MEKSEIWRGNWNLHTILRRFIRFNIDSKEKPRMVSFYKKKSNSDLLEPARHEQRPVNNQVKKDCSKLTRKYLSQRAQAFYASLACEEDSVDNEG